MRETVSFEPLEEGFLGKFLSNAREMCSRMSPSSIRSAWAIGSQNDSSQAFLRAWKPGSYVSEFATPAGTIYVTADPTVMRAVLAHSRKAKDGVFYDHQNKRLFVEGIVNDLYPEDIREIGLEKAVDMVVITAATPHAAILRAPMIKNMGPAAIQGDVLRDIADTVLKKVPEECDVSQMSFEYAVRVISRLFTGYETSPEGYTNLAKALDAFSKRMTRIVSHRPATAEEEKEYAAALLEMRTVIELCVSSPYVQGLKEAGWNDFQIKTNLFFLYFAGSETTASSMNYLIWQLGRVDNKALQQEIREKGQPLLLKVIAEALRLHPPAFIEGRQLREDTLMTIKDKDNNLLWKKKLRCGHSIVCLTQAAGLDPQLYPEPGQFNPYRFQDPRIAALSFLPFGSGPHTCPGQHLAVAELQTFIQRLLTHFSVHTLSPEKVDQKGFFTLRATPAQVRLIKN